MSGPHQYFSFLPLYCIYPYLYNDRAHHTSNLPSLRQRVVLGNELLHLNEGNSETAQMGFHWKVCRCVCVLMRFMCWGLETWLHCLKLSRSLATCLCPISEDKSISGEFCCWGTKGPPGLSSLGSISPAQYESFSSAPSCSHFGLSFLFFSVGE